jgi:hypothetical protein
MMKSATLWLTVGLLGALLVTHPAHAEPASRTLAFVVGIERYDDPELNKLQFAADDARAIYDRLSILAKIDQDASTLLVADDAGTNVSADELREALQKFVTRIRDNDKVIVYLGGHGTLAGRGNLRYLASNYNYATRTNYVAFNDIVEAISDELATPLQDVSVTILVNMCNAGNAAGVVRMDVPQEVVNLAKQFWRDNKFGLERLAIIPATQAGRDTFEDANLKKSVFAHHLLDGLSGLAARDSEITTESLIDYVETKLGALPRNHNFAGNIVLGKTLQFEGEAEYAVGTALLAAAQSLGPSSADKQVRRHRTALLDVASSHFGRVSVRAPDLRDSAQLRLTQIDLLQERSPSIDRANVREDGAVQAREPEARATLERLLSESKVQGPATPKVLHDTLQEGAAHYALILQQNQPAVLRERTRPWEELFGKFPANRGTKVIPFNLPRASDADDDGTLGASAAEAIAEWASAQGADGGSWPRLLVVYSGNSLRVDNDLKPFGAADIARIAAQWQGPITVFHLASFGGVLAEHPMRENISLLLAAREKNGLTSPGTSAEIAMAFAGGVERLEEYRSSSEAENFRMLLRGRTEFVVGTPAWLPTGKRYSDLARSTLEPLSRFALHVAAGCVLEPERVCEEKSLGKFGLRSAAEQRAEDPFDSLSRAAEADLAGRLDEADALYASLANSLNSANANDQPDSQAAGTARAMLGVIARRALERREANSLSDQRKVVLMPVGIADYANPQAYDLPKTVLSDLSQYTKVVGEALQGRAAVVLREPQSPKSASTFLSDLATEAQSLAADDLLVMIYSGRGAQYAGRRYLAMAGAEPCYADDPFEEAEEEVPTECNQRPWTELVDLWDIAKVFEGKWFLAIYDTQFSELEGDRTRIQEKGLPQPRERGSATPALSELQTADPHARRQMSLNALPRGRLPERQLHVWVEGSLVQANRPYSCRPDTSRTASQLATPLLADLSRHLTSDYRHWLTAVAESDCFRDSDLGLSAQGELRLPLFSSSKAAELVSLARGGHVRQLANLYVADAVIDQYAKRYESPRFEFARGAVLGAIALVQDADAQITPPMKSRAALHDAAMGSLGSANIANDLTDEQEELLAIQLEMLTRCKALRDGSANALEQLRTTNQRSLLSRRELPEVLVELTDETSRRQPVELVQQALGVIEDLEREGAQLVDGELSASLKAAKLQAQGMLNSEMARRTTAYSIRPPQSRELDGRAQVTHE